jgi:ribosomal protein S18 acetylase RimI-like enzyme
MTKKARPAVGASDGITIVEADLSRRDHQEAVLAMADAYSSDPMGDAKPLDPDVRARLVSALRQFPTTLIILAFAGQQPVGSAVCFLGFSTFRAKPLLNIHDCAVLPEYRGLGIGRMLLDGVERKARALGCCKLTLEVMDKNQRALRAYQSFGFAQSVLQAEAGQAIFMAKPLI